MPLFLRTVRLDATDSRVFEVAAEPDEWAVSGAFAFAADTPNSLAGKRLQAFRHGFLGTASFGRSTFVRIAEASDAEVDAVVERLSAHAVECYGAPDHRSARPAAEDEVAFAASLCTHRVNTLLSVERFFDEQGIREQFRVVTPPREPQHARIWTIVTDDDAPERTD